MQVSLADQQKQQQLSQKRIWISSALGYFIPIASYIYTQRWQPLLDLLHEWREDEKKK